MAQRLSLSLKRVDAAAVTEQTQSSSEASNPSNCFSHHLGPGVGPGPALHSAETKQKAQRNGRWSRYCLSVEWKRTKRKSGFTAASGAHSEAGQISGIFFTPQTLLPRKHLFCRQPGVLRHQILMEMSRERRNNKHFTGKAVSKGVAAVALK